MSSTHHKVTTRRELQKHKRWLMPLRFVRLFSQLSNTNKQTKDFIFLITPSKTQEAVEIMTKKLEESAAAAKRAKEAAAEAKRRADEAKRKADEAKRTAAEAKRTAEAAKKATEAAKKATAAAKEAAAKAKATAEAAKKAAEAAWFAEQENKKALDELRSQEAAFEAKKAELTKIKTDESIGVVKRNKAANELDQLMAEDPLPLRKAKINQQATVKKSERARAAADEAKAKAESDAAAAEAAAKKAEAAEREAIAAQHVAEDAQRAAEAAQREAEAAQAAAETAQAAAEAAQAAAEAAEQAAQESVKEAEAKFQEALDFLEAEKKKGGIARGDIWWMEREIKEKRKYLPASKQK